MASLVHPERYQTERRLDTVRRLLGWSAPSHAWRIRAGASPLGDLAVGEFVLFISYILCGLALPISPFFMLLLEDFGVQLQHLTPHSIIQAAIFAHLCEMFVVVASCTSLFRHFFMLVKSGKAKDHLGAYYFQMRADLVGAYISSLNGARWENWWAKWVIASTEANDRLVHPSDGPRLDRKQWRAKPPLTPEFEPVLGRIKSLETSGLTSMHVVGDFLQRRIVPLQARARLSCWFTGSNDLGRVLRRLGTDLSWEELELLVKGITGESFVAKSLIPPEGIPPLCDDQGLRTVILDSLSTLDESGVAVRQTGGQDPHRGIQIPGVLAGGSWPADIGSRAPPSSKGKGAVSSSSAPGGSGRSEGERWHRVRRADGSFIADPPLDSSLPQKRQRTAGGVGEAILGLAEARQSSTSTTISPTATIIWLATATGAAASTIATLVGAVDASLPRSLEGPGAQVSVPPFHFPHCSSYHVDGY
jgi:hypothetical protein